MSRNGSYMGGLLRHLHADPCSQKAERMACLPVVRDVHDAPGQRIEVVAMEWCPECGAADWEVV